MQRRLSQKRTKKNGNRQFATIVLASIAIIAVVIAATTPEVIKSFEYASYCSCVDNRAQCKIDYNLCEQNGNNLENCMSYFNRTPNDGSDDCVSTV
jgi:hypothetical protein